MGARAPVVRFTRFKNEAEFREVEMAEQAQVDFFTVRDREVQTRQTVILEEIVKRLDRQDQASAAMVTEHERRLRSLEETRLEIRAQGKLVLALVGLIAAVVGSGVHILLDWLKPH